MQHSHVSTIRCYFFYLLIVNSFMDLVLSFFISLRGFSTLGFLVYCAFLLLGFCKKQDMFIFFSYDIHEGNVYTTRDETSICVVIGK